MSRDELFQAEQPSDPRWLVIVRRENRGTYTNLSKSFEADPRVEVILDRRAGSRRSERQAIQADRRRAQRRSSLTPSETAVWEAAGSRLVPRPGA